MKKLLIGRMLDAAISRHVFGRAPSLIRLMQILRVHPRYSTDWRAAQRVIFHFYNLPRGSAETTRYNEYFERFGPNPRGFVGLVVAGSCPSTVCDAALFAIRQQNHE